MTRVEAATLGEWQAFEGLWDRAAAHLEEARRGRAPIRCLTLARCYWELGDPPALPGEDPGAVLQIKAPDEKSAAEDLRRARREFLLARDQKEAPAEYLDLCLAALKNPDAPGNPR